MYDKSPRRSLASHKISTSLWLALQLQRTSMNTRMRMVLVQIPMACYRFALQCKNIVEPGGHQYTPQRSQKNLSTGRLANTVVRYIYQGTHCQVVQVPQDSLEKCPTQTNRKRDIGDAGRNQSMTCAMEGSSYEGGTANYSLPQCKLSFLPCSCWTYCQSEICSKSCHAQPHCSPEDRKKQ